jgi:hypothetical protein
MIVGVVPPETTIVIVTDSGELVPELLLAVMLTVFAPAAVGVPVIAPVDVLNVNPAGKVPLSA